MAPSEDASDLPLSKIGSVPVSRRSPEERKQEVDAVLKWLRNGKKPKDDVTGDFEKIDQLLPRQPGQKPSSRARDIEGALDWMRNNGVKADETKLPFDMEKLAPALLDQRSSEERQRDLLSVLSWLRNGMDDENDPTGNFAKIEEFLPTQEGQSLRDRAVEIEEALDWICLLYTSPSPRDRG